MRLKDIIHRGFCTGGPGVILPVLHFRPPTHLTDTPHKAMPTKKKTTRKKSPGKKTPGKKTTRKKTTRSKSPSTEGKHLVIVESPAKAKTINKYLGPDYVVQASVGHIRDLPAKAPKGSKQPVPGVDLENNFEPTYEVLDGKKSVVADLKRAAKNAIDVWFATDLDREGEAIAWHLTHVLGIKPSSAKRVVFNAITRRDIEHAFANPHNIDEDMVNAQQARRILDRIVGYQASPLLWKKVARGLSAGRVQSVAVRIIVDREREIAGFIPDESWKVTARLCLDPAEAPAHAPKWRKFMAQRDERNNAPTIKKQNAWLTEHHSIKAELVELSGKKFNLGCTKDNPQDLTDRVQSVSEATGLHQITINTQEDPTGKGPARFLRTVEAEVDPACRYQVKSIETKRTSSRPPAPFITSSLQMAASSFLGFGAQRTMRTAQQLYEGVVIKGEGQVGLITYMRTDSTHLSGDSLGQVRHYIESTHGNAYLPDKPNFFGSKNKDAQEAHEAVHPTDTARHPDQISSDLTEDQAKLYRLIWNRFVACQMTPAQWDATAVLLERSDKKTGAIFKTTGRVLIFDGFYRVAGVPNASDEQTLPEMQERQELAPFNIEPKQLFTSPPPRYSEASLVKTLEAEGIGRPSTYAAIIQVIQSRNYVEQINRRFFATDLGEVVTDKMIEAFPRLMDLGYTRQMEEELDKIAEQHANWKDMLKEFYARFSQSLERAHEELTHAKAELRPAPYKCPECSSHTVYRFGKNGRFLSCGGYPDCNYAAPINREGQPQLPERVDVQCPEDGSDMILRTGRFGKFLASVNYPEVKAVVNLDKKAGLKYPSPPALLTDLICEKCESKMNLRRGKRGPWLGCSTFPKCRGRLGWKTLEDDVQKALEAQLEEHEKQHPQVIIRNLDGDPIPEGTPIADLVLPGGTAKLEIHPDAPPNTSPGASPGNSPTASPAAA